MQNRPITLLSMHTIDVILLTTKNVFFLHCYTISYENIHRSSDCTKYRNNERRSALMHIKHIWQLFWGKKQSHNTILYSGLDYTFHDLIKTLHFPLKKANGGVIDHEPSPRRRILNQAKGKENRLTRNILILCQLRLPITRFEFRLRLGSTCWKTIRHEAVLS